MAHIPVPLIVLAVMVLGMVAVALSVVMVTAGAPSSSGERRVARLVPLRHGWE
jgi:hypothetical protein